MLLHGVARGSGQDFVDTRRPHQKPPTYSSGNFSKTRELVGFAVDIATRFNSGSDRDNQRQACCEQLFQVYQMLYSGPTMYNDVECLNFRHHVMCFLRHYTWLTWDANNRGKREWHLVQKFHYLRHMAADVVSMNPMHGSCLADEDFVGKIASIAAASTRGTSTLRLPSKVVIQFYRGLAVRWHAQLGERVA